MLFTHVNLELARGHGPVLGDDRCFLLRVLVRVRKVVVVAVVGKYRRSSSAGVAAAPQEHECHGD